MQSMYRLAALGLLAVARDVDASYPSTANNMWMDDADATTRQATAPPQTMEEKKDASAFKDLMNPWNHPEHWRGASHVEGESEMEQRGHAKPDTTRAPTSMSVETQNIQETKETKEQRQEAEEFDSIMPDPVTTSPSSTASKAAPAHLRGPPQPGAGTSHARVVGALPQPSAYELEHKSGFPKEYWKTHYATPREAFTGAPTPQPTRYEPVMPTGTKGWKTIYTHIFGDDTGDHPTVLTDGPTSIPTAAPTAGPTTVREGLPHATAFQLKHRAGLSKEYWNSHFAPAPTLAPTPVLQWPNSPDALTTASPGFMSDGKWVPAKKTPEPTPGLVWAIGLDEEVKFSDVERASEECNTGIQKVCMDKFHATSLTMMSAHCSKCTAQYELTLSRNFKCLKWEFDYWCFSSLQGTTMKVAYNKYEATKPKVKEIANDPFTKTKVAKSTDQCHKGIAAHCLGGIGASDVKSFQSQCIKCATTLNEKEQWKKSYGCTVFSIEYLCGKIHAHSLASAYRKYHKTSGGRSQVYVREGLRPRGGFKTAAGETAACILDKGEKVVTVMHALAHCSNFTEHRGLCYSQRVQKLMMNLKLCCYGNEFLELEGDEVRCKSTTMPLIDYFQTKLLPTWSFCTQHPDNFACSTLRSDTKAFHTCAREDSKGQLYTWFHDPQCVSSMDNYFKPIVETYEKFLKAAGTLYARSPHDMTPEAYRIINQCNPKILPLGKVGLRRCEWSLVKDTHKFSDQTGWCAWGRKKC